MAISPLELYENAYRLHYTENRIPDAVNLYKQLIKEFPDANECGYAVIQLQKIKAQNVAASFSATVPVAEEKKLTPVTMFCFLLSIGSLLFSVYLYKSFSTRLTTEKKMTATAMNALGKIARNEPEEALQLLNEFKQHNPEAIAPYELSADIFRKQQKYDEAQKEYRTYFENNPEVKPTPSESTYMNYGNSPHRARVNTGKPPPPSPAVAAKKQNSLSARKKLSKKRSRPPKPPSPKNSTTQKKGIYLIDPDSVSYF